MVSGTNTFSLVQFKDSISQSIQNKWILRNDIKIQQYFNYITNHFKPLIAVDSLLIKYYTLQSTSVIIHILWVNKILPSKRKKQMEKENIVSIEDRIPKLKEARKKKANRRLVFYLSIFFLLISIIVYLQSPLSQVKHIEVNGNLVLSDEDVVKKSGLTLDTNIWMVRKKGLKGKVEELPVVNEVEVHRKLPQTIQLDVKEHQIIGYMKVKDAYHPLLQNGKIISNGDITNQGNGPVLHDFKDDVYLERIAAELNDIPDDISNMISEITWVPTKKNKYKIMLYMNDGFIVEATIRNFAAKMKAYPSIVSQLDEEAKGIIHMGVGTYFEKTQK